VIIKLKNKPFIYQKIHKSTKSKKSRLCDDRSRRAEEYSRKSECSLLEEAIPNGVNNSRDPAEHTQHNIQHYMEDKTRAGSAMENDCDWREKYAKDELDYLLASEVATAFCSNVHLLAIGRGG